MRIVPVRIKYGIQIMKKVGFVTAVIQQIYFS
jgi:hypothetical protein